MDPSSSSRKRNEPVQMTSPTTSKRSRRTPSASSSWSKEDSEESSQIKTGQNSSEEDFFQRLPDEMLVHIFSFLDRDDLAYGVTQVCQRFQALSLVEIPSDKIMDTRTAIRLLDRCTQIKQLSLLKERRDAEFLVTYALMKCRRLESLEMLSLDDEGMKNVLKTIGECGNALKRFKVLGKTKTLLGNVRHLKRLTHIEIDFLQEGLLREIAHNCKRLRLFRQHRRIGAVEEEEMQYFLKGIKTTISSLIIQQWMSDASVNSLGNCRFLERLEVSGRMSTDLLQSVSSLSELKILSLSSPGGIKPKMISLAFSDGKLKNLTSLELKGCSLDAESFLSIAKNFPKLSVLKVENSSLNLVTNKGWKIMAHNCKNLESFSYNGYMTNAAIQSFLTKVTRNIRCLNITKKLWTESSLKKLEKCELLDTLGMTANKMQLPRLRLISNLPRLKALTFVYSDLTGKNLVVGLGSRTLKQLTHLDLISWKNLDDEGLEEIANCCPELTSITLNYCFKITTVGLTTLICKCCKLRKLELTQSFDLTAELEQMNPKLELIQNDQKYW